MGNLSQRIQGEIPRPFDGNNIFTCTIKNTISIAINPQRADFWFEEIEPQYLIEFQLHR